MRRLRAILVVGAAVMLGGCAGQPWASSFQSSGPAAAPLPADASVTLREVPWERIQRTLEELQQERAASDVHPDEWSPERKASAKSELLRGLQVSGDPAGIDVLGRSEFRTTRPVRPSDGELERFARSIGATLVVWSRTYLGRTTTTVQEPVTEFTTGTNTYRDRRGKWRSDRYSEHSTIWVPVQVEADEHAWMAYFLREGSAAAETIERERRR
ncbi:MAG: hypothetical protein JNK58_10260 [Phycisphaerae bacterium]|nr:hypothetical protein [Phycisphaerae bacterium]